MSDTKTITVRKDLVYNVDLIKNQLANQMCVMTKDVPFEDVFLAAAGFDSTFESTFESTTGAGVFIGRCFPGDLGLTGALVSRGWDCPSSNADANSSED